MRNESDPSLQAMGPVEAARQLSINDRLAMIELIDDGMRAGASGTPIVADLFSNLWDLVNVTVAGSKIDRLKPKSGQNGFRTLEIISEDGDNLGRLNMLYLKKPMPCYYLVYVEVAAPYRRKGLGNRVLIHFREFLEAKGAMGILDNIIPENDPTFDIYSKQAWESVENIIGDAMEDAGAHYMVYIPYRYRNRDVREAVLRLVHHLQRKRDAIDMRDNQEMVRRTIAEFRDLYAALLAYFDEDILNGASTPLMRFMFTRFMTKLVSFRRRIASLLGYTGGDSLEQFVLTPEIGRLPIQSYAPQELAGDTLQVNGQKEVWAALPEDLKNNPAGHIEALANYQRPSLMTWQAERGTTPQEALTLADMMDLGFDPTRLKEIAIDGQVHIFERIQARQVPELEKKKQLLEAISREMPMERVRNAKLNVNPPLLVIQDRGNAYVLRKKVEGVHWEEALEQLQSVQSLKALNATARVDRLIVSSVSEALKRVSDRLGVKKGGLPGLLTCFVSWNMKANQPRLTIDFSTTSLEGLWFS
ncbi:MAG: hypothetical protein JRK53_06975 [Deltaproteobacteria bacterium]|nr:hypothetical protein [Deltaproteobacteria bacterium]MBW1815665.1 hypothetical protein [Deltaproteobacteria bacterium]